MIKFKLNDIVIKSPGMQIRDKIIEKYGSVENYADVIQLYETSINQYLSSRNLGSTTFKIRTMQAFGCNFNDLYMTETEQIRYFTSTVSWYIDRYNQLKDIEILERLKKITIEKELMEDYAIICRCFAYYYRNQGRHDRALSYIELAVNYMRGKKNIDRFGLYLSDLIVMRLPIAGKSGMGKLLDEFHVTLSQVEGPLTKGHMFANLAQMFYEYKEDAKCIENLRKASEYLKDPQIAARLLIRMANADKRLGAWDAALEALKVAESLLDPEDETIRFVYEGYALYYLENGDLIKSEAYVEEIFKNPKWYLLSTDNQFISTIAEVKVRCLREEAMLNVLDQLLKELHLGYLYALQHLDYFDSVLESYGFRKDLLIKMRDMIIRRIHGKHLEEDHRNRLKQILGTIAIQLSTETIS